MKFRLAGWIGALLALAMCVMAMSGLMGCGGQTGGFPSGISGALQQVSLATNVVAISTSKTALLRDSLSMVAESTSSAENSFAVTLKGAGADSKDVTFQFDTGMKSALLPSAGEAVEPDGTNPRTGDGFPIYRIPATRQVAGSSVVNDEFLYLYLRSGTKGKDSLTDVEVRAGVWAHTGSVDRAVDLSGAFPTTLTLTELVNGAETNVTYTTIDFTGLQRVPGAYRYVSDDSSKVTKTKGRYTTLVRFFNVRKVDQDLTTRANPTPPYFTVLLTSLVEFKDNKAFLTGGISSISDDPALQYAQAAKYSPLIENVPDELTSVTVEVREVPLSKDDSSAVFTKVLSVANGVVDSEDISIINRLRPFVVRAYGRFNAGDAYPVATGLTTQQQRIPVDLPATTAVQGLSVSLASIVTAASGETMTVNFDPEHPYVDGSDPRSFSTASVLATVDETPRFPTSELNADELLKRALGDPVESTDNAVPIPNESVIFGDPLSQLISATPAGSGFVAGRYFAPNPIASPSTTQIPFTVRIPQAIPSAPSVSAQVPVNIGSTAANSDVRVRLLGSRLPKRGFVIARAKEENPTNQDNTFLTDPVDASNVSADTEFKVNVTNRGFRYTPIAELFASVSNERVLLASGSGAVDSAGDPIDPATIAAGESATVKLDSKFVGFGAITLKDKNDFQVKLGAGYQLVINANFGPGAQPIPPQYFGYEIVSDSNEINGSPTSLIKSISDGFIQFNEPSSANASDQNLDVQVRVLYEDVDGVKQSQLVTLTVVPAAASAIKITPVGVPTKAGSLVASLTEVSPTPSSRTVTVNSFGQFTVDMVNNGLLFAPIVRAVSELDGGGVALAEGNRRDAPSAANFGPGDDAGNVTLTSLLGGTPFSGITVGIDSRPVASTTILDRGSSFPLNLSLNLRDSLADLSASPKNVSGRNFTFIEVSDPKNLITIDGNGFITVANTTEFNQSDIDELVTFRVEYSDVGGVVRQLGTAGTPLQLRVRKSGGGLTILTQATALPPNLRSLLFKATDQAIGNQVYTTFLNNADLAGATSGGNVTRLLTVIDQNSPFLPELSVYADGGASGLLLARKTGANVDIGASRQIDLVNGDHFVANIPQVEANVKGVTVTLSDGAGWVIGGPSDNDRISRGTTIPLGMFVTTTNSHPIPSDRNQVRKIDNRNFDVTVDNATVAEISADKSSVIIKPASNGNKNQVDIKVRIKYFFNGTETLNSVGARFKEITIRVKRSTGDAGGGIG